MSAVDGFDFTKLRAELEAQRDTLKAQLPEARRAYIAALRAYEDAGTAWDRFCAQIERALKCGSDEPNRIVTVTPVLHNMIADRRAEYDKVAAAMVRARKHVENLEWSLEGRNLDLEQLYLLEHPAKPPVVPAVPRSKPVVEDDLDSIVIPFRSERVA